MPYLARFARARSASRAHSQVTAVRGLRRNAAMCCDAHQPTPQTATPSFASAVGISAPCRLTAGGDRLARFRREAQVLAAVNHPHIGEAFNDEACAHHWFENV